MCLPSLLSPAGTFGGLLTSFCFKVTMFHSLLRDGSGLLGIRTQFWLEILTPLVLCDLRRHVRASALCEASAVSGPGCATDGWDHDPCHASVFPPVKEESWSGDGSVKRTVLARLTAAAVTDKPWDFRASGRNSLCCWDELLSSLASSTRAFGSGPGRGHPLADGGRGLPGRSGGRAWE